MINKKAGMSDFQTNFSPKNLTERRVETMIADPLAVDMSTIGTQGRTMTWMAAPQRVSKNPSHHCSDFKGLLVELLFVVFATSFSLLEFDCFLKAVFIRM